MRTQTFILITLISTCQLYYALNFLLLPVAAASSSFKCNSTTTCDAVIDYVLPNTTTLSSIQKLFNVKNLRSILGANNLPLSTLPNLTFPPASIIKIPFHCICTNGTGKSNKRPIYKVRPNDGLYHIAAEIFSGLVTYFEIQAVNQIRDANLVRVGQKLWIPLPCSCDEVESQEVVHYGHVVQAGSSVEAIAQQYNASQDVLLTLNGLANPKDLQAGSVLDVPLRACSSMVSNNSLDYPLLVSNGTYVFTASNCVMCNCNAANNWILQCQPTQIRSSLWASCPNVQCAGSENLFLGNTSSSGCDMTTCAYAGYTNQTILTQPSLESTCPASEDNSSAISLEGCEYYVLSIFFHLLLLFAL